MSKKKTHEEFILQMKDLHPDLEVLDVYDGAFKPLRCRCNKHNYEWLVKPNVLLSGHGCPKCGYENVSTKLRARSHEEFLAELAEINPDIEVLDRYDRVDDFLKCRCRKDGYEWISTGKRLLRGDGCPQCSGVAKLTHDEFVRRIASINPDVEIIGTYRARHTHVTCRCRICGHEWEATPGNLYAGWGCPACSQSHGEIAIQRYLDTHNYVYRREYSFADCRYEHALLFDFYLPDRNLLIEYDGEQHFRPVKFGGSNDDKADKRFELNQIRDQIKNDYCASRHIPLIRIPYTDFDRIDEILDEHIA